VGDRTTVADQQTTDCSGFEPGSAQQCDGCVCQTGASPPSPLENRRRILETGVGGVDRYPIRRPLEHHRGRFPGTQIGTQLRLQPFRQLKAGRYEGFRSGDNNCVGFGGADWGQRGSDVNRDTAAGGRPHILDITVTR
jgi:hypothetical protein